MTHRKTTIDIADPILKRAKRLAARRHSTLKVLIEDGLRDALAKAEKHVEREVTTPTVQGNGLPPGVSWDDWAVIRRMGCEGRGA